MKTKASRNRTIRLWGARREGIHIIESDHTGTREPLMWPNGMIPSWHTAERRNDQMQSIAAQLRKAGKTVEIFP